MPPVWRPEVRQQAPTPIDPTDAGPLATAWRGPGGMREALVIGTPLMVSMGSTTLMQFADRIFLGQHSVAELAASWPAAMASFLFMGFFMGAASCVGVLVAQYAGACRFERVGPALWQGLWFSLAAALALAGLAQLGGPLFALAGHEAQVQALEADYFRLITMGSGLGIVATVFSAYFSGRGMTLPVMVVNLAVAAFNIPLAYALILGRWGAPELGIHGAALATIISWGLNCLLYIWLTFRDPEAEARFRVRSGWRLDRVLLRQLLDVGLPAGVQFFLDIMAMTAFLLLVGRIGLSELSATNIAFSINALTYLPVIGLSIATSTLVGRSLGQNRPDIARRATRNVLLLAVSWMAVVGLVFVLTPGPLLELFRPPPDAVGAENYDAIRATGVVLLRYVAAYSLVDAVSVICFGALKGAGDTRFVMLTMLGATVLALMLPTWLLVHNGIGGVHGPWICMTIYILVLAGGFALRFASGIWQRKRLVQPAQELGDKPGESDACP